EGPVVWNVSTEGLAASGTAHTNLSAETLDGQFQVALSSFAGLVEFFPVLEDADGTIQAQGTFHGPWSRPVYHVILQGQDVVFQDRGIGELHADVSGDLAHRGSIQFQGQAKDVSWNLDKSSPWDISFASATLQGNSPHWQPAISGKFRNEDL